MRKGIAVNLIIHMNTLVITIISILYIYQMGYIGVVFIGEYIRKRRRKNHAEPLVKTNRYAAIISARNESGVIGQLLDTIRAQTYPAEFLDAIVIADNCTDDTAQVRVTTVPLSMNALTKSRSARAMRWIICLIS